MQQLTYKVFHTIYQFPFYLWWMETVLKLYEILKYFKQGFSNENVDNMTCLYRN